VWCVCGVSGVRERERERERERSQHNLYVRGACVMGTMCGVGGGGGDEGVEREW